MNDLRRGAGSYDLVVHNLRSLVEMGYTTGLSLATVLPLRIANGPPGDAVRALAKKLGIRRTRFRPVLPLGRAADSEPDIVSETLWGHMDPREVVTFGLNPTSSCGMGQNLYVEPDGGAYPCCAWHGEQWRLGSIHAKGGLAGVITSSAFRDLARYTVDTNHQCRKCLLRYLCGGACRAWNRQSEQEQTDLDEPPQDCSPLHKRAQSLILSALDHLGITVERWTTVGLPLLETQPKVDKVIR